MSTLNLFPARVPIGRVVLADGSEVDVLMTPEFLRALTLLFERVGGPVGMSSDDLALNVPLDQGASLAVLFQQLLSLQAQVAELAGLAAHVGALWKALAGVELQATFRDPFRVNWERPGQIGKLTPNSGLFTTVNRLTLTLPAVGATFTLANGKTFTVSNTLTLTATDGATLAIGGGGTLGTAAYTNSTAYAPAGGSLATNWLANSLTAAGAFGCNGAIAQSSYALGAAATDLASVITLANNLRTMAINNGIGS